jgi:RNA polymerase sigma factor (sigma-70 family)
MKAVVLSPTTKILKQTRDSFQEFAPEVDISSYYHYEQDLSGNVINTTYQSIGSLVEGGRLDPEEVDIVICDEVHTALGEQRHTIFRNFPNALKVGLTATPYFAPIEGFKKRGIVNEDEEWLGLFEKRIHEMPIEEAMDLGLLSKLDVNYIRTNIEVGNIGIDAKGKYVERDVRKYLDKSSRDALVLGMIKGVDAIPEGVELDRSKKGELEEISRKISGRKTLVFGLSVDHVEELAATLRENGISARAVHGGLSSKKQDEVFDSFETGETQVMLGVDLIRLGFDSPDIEAGIFLAPTQSGIVAVQELGRILRTSEGKERAIAVQVVDEYRLRHQSPVLITDVFDPYYVLRGASDGRENRVGTRSRHRGSSPITVSGYKVESVIERAKIDEILRSRLRNASIDEINEAVDGVVRGVEEKEQITSTHELLKKVSEAMPFRVSGEANQVVLRSIASIDSNEVEKGKKALVFLYAGTILSAVDRFITEDGEENDEICSSAIEAVLSRISDVKTERVIAGYIYMTAERGAVSYIAQKEFLPSAWIINDRHYHEIMGAISDIKGNTSYTDSEIAQTAEELNEETGISSDLLVSYLSFRRDLKNLEEGDFDKAVIESGLFEETVSREMRETVYDVLRTIPPRERRVLEMRFGLLDREERTLREISEEFAFTHTRAGQISARGIKMLRWKRRTHKLDWLLDDYDPDSGRNW